ncbi:MAG: hypothetical protein AAGC44_02755 [Planctomycetota bacterium]
MPRKPLTPDQQLAALDKVQSQATQRIKLGQQLFKAAEARLTQHQEILDKIRNQQQDLREQVQEDVAKSLQTYDQWMGKIDEGFTGSIRDLTERLDQLEAEQRAGREEMQSMVARATALMEQTQQLLMESLSDRVEPEPGPSTHEAQDQSGAQPNPLESAMIRPQIEVEADPIEGTHREEPPTAADDPSGPLKIGDEVMGLNEEEDVFGQVLKRLRDADAAGHEGEQAA